MELRRETVSKPLSHVTYHYFDGATYVGAVWQTDADGPWSAHCTTAVKEGLYGHLGDFDSENEALDCLKRRLGGDKTAKGKDAD